MSDFDNQDDDMSLEDLDKEEDSGFSNKSDDWGDSLDDMDAEAWDNEYRKDENDENEDDPWALS